MQAEAIEAARPQPVRRDALDLSALAWVQNELRRSLDAAHKALRRFVRESQTLSDSDVDVVDPSILRTARRQLHQGIGALELVGLPAAAQLLRASEAVVQRFAGRPGTLGLPVVEAIEHASFALLDYIGRLLAGQRVAPLALFPQYRAVQEYAGADRIHPADLWPHDWHWLELPDDPAAAPATADAQMQRALEQQLLALMKSPAGSAAFQAASERMGLLCARLGAAAQRAADRPRSATLWKLAAAVFEAQAEGLLVPDVFSKRVASRLLPQFRQLDRGDGEASERLAHDLLFFCAQAAAPSAERPAPRLAAVRSVYGLSDDEAVDYGAGALGRFDPAAVAQARKRVAAAKESWAAAAAGEGDRLGPLAEQFALVGDSLKKLYPAGDRLADALLAALAAAQRNAGVPTVPLAMEVATSLLYLEASLEDAELDQPAQGDRALRLAERIDTARSGGAAEALEPWMKALYRRISDRQTLGSVVQELRTSLAASEQLIDHFFRHSTDADVLLPVPQQLQAMRGVFSVLALDQASHAVLRMRDDIDRLLSKTGADDETARSAIFDRLAGNLGALGFLIDMFSVQPQMAQALFAFDEERGLLEPVAGPPPDAAVLDAADADAARPGAADAAATTSPAAFQPVSLDLPPPAEPPAAPPAAAATALPADFGADEEMRGVFLEEAREVLADAAVALAELRHAPDDLPSLTTLRRAFHTLKGSSRMVGLGEFGDAAWVVEQVFNTRLAEQRPADDRLHDFTERVLGSLAGWVDAIADGRGVDRRAAGEIVAAHDIYGAAVATPAPVRAFPAALPDAAKSPRVTAGAPEPDAVPTPPFAGMPTFDDTAGFDVPFEFEWAPAPGATPPLVPLGFPVDLPSAADLELPRAASSPADEIGAAADAVPSAEPAGPAEAPMAAEAGTGNFELAFENFAPAEAAPSVELPAAAEASVAEATTDDFALAFESFGPAGIAPSAEPAEPAATPEVAKAEAGAFDLAFESFELALPVGETPAASQAALPAEPAPALEPPVAVAAPEAEPAALSTLLAEVPEPAGPSLDFEIDFATGNAATTPDDAVEAPLVAAVEAPAGDEAGIKRVGPLRIGLPLFDIYLNEAEDLSRRLAGRLADWTHVLDTPVGDDAVALAHSLAGSSATVGFAGLSQLARGLEHTLTQSHRVGHGSLDDARLFVGVAEQIRHLLHQFAAGVLKAPPAELLDALAEREAALALERQARGDVDAEAEADSAYGGATETADADSLGGEIVGAVPDGLDTRFDDALPAVPTQPPPLAAMPDTPAVALPAIAPPPVPVPMPMPVHAFVEAAPLGGRPGFKPLAEASIEPLPATPARADALDADEEIDAVDAVDAELFPIFAEEGRELLPQLASRLRDWAERPQDAAAPAGAMRTLHTLKGAARLAGAMRLGEMCHRLETRIGHLLAATPVDAAGVEALQGRSDALVAALDGLQVAGPAAVAPAAGRLPALADAEVPATPPLPASDAPARGAQPFDALPFTAAAQPQPPAVAPPPVAAVGTTPAPRSAAAPGIDADAGTDAIDWSRFIAAGGTAQPAGRAGAAPVQSTVRVRTPLLDRLINQAGEVSITRTRVDAEMQRIKSSLGDLSDNLERLRRQLRDLELQAELQVSSRLEAAKAAAQSFDPLEFDRYTRFQELTRMIAESVNDVATVQRTLLRSTEGAEDALAAQSRLTRNLQDDLLRTRMVEFEGQSERLYRVVRQAAKESGKQVRLDIVGGSIEIDRGVLDRMMPSFEHLLRNAVAHGIEPPAARRAAGKDETGSIGVSLQHVGNEVAVEFRDDGGGLDLGRIRSRALASGLLADAAAADDAVLAALVFEPGFSTAEQVTELAGRGIGLDVVRSEVNAMGGRIESATTAGRGTSFKLVLPLTTAVTQVLMLRCGTLRVAVPSTLVETVQRIGTEELRQAYASGSHPYGDAALPFFWLGALLQSGRRSEEGAPTRSVVVIRSAQQRIALHVDEVVGNQEAVVKNLGPQLARVPGLAGMTLLPSGDVALIYNPVALAAVYGESIRASTADTREAADDAARRAAAEAEAPLVLVVDDSLTVRRVTQRLLAREGFRVVVAKDGLEALARLAEEKPRVVLSDIEMPRMDGFDLVRNLRADARLRDLPVIMITSRIAQKHRDYAAQLGVDHYLGKPYSEDELLGLVRRYTAAAPAALH